MIGRFSHQDNFRQLLSIREFYTVLAGGLLIAASYLLSNVYHNQPISAVLALSALALLGGPIIKGAITGLLERKVNVDELVSLAIIASVVIGEYISAAIVAFIMVLGSLLEKYVSEKARSAIHALIKLKPSQATVLRNGEEFTVPISEIRPGDIIIVHPGEQIPVDGIVTKGLAAVNQASLTGESLPADIGVGGFVYAGSIIQSGMLIVEAKKVGMDTTFGKLVQLVQEAERLRAPILRVADNYARYFTPFVIGLSLLAYLVTDDVYRAITILIVGCPCAFILAAPTAVTAALGNAARNGVLIRGGALLEELGRIDAVVFDKTGTLTTGRPFIERVISLNGESQHNILRLAASAERYSEHPLAKAILEAAKNACHPLGEPRVFVKSLAAGLRHSLRGERSLWARYPIRNISMVSSGNRSYPPAHVWQLRITMFP